MPDYRQLWEDKSGDAPKESVIAGLQKLINNKQDTIIEMDAQIQGLKGRIQEYNEILTEMETQFRAQQVRIKELEGGDATSATSIPSKPSISTESSSSGASNANMVKKLQAKLNEMQNKLFIYSNLPSRISDLEQKLEEKNETIDEYFDQVASLRKRIKKLSGEQGAADVVNELEEKVQRQKELIKKLRTGQAQGASSTPSQDHSKMGELRDKISTYRIENEELKKQLMSLQNTVENLQSGESGGIGGSNLSSSEIAAENNRLKISVKNLKDQLREKDLKLEEIIENVQKGKGAAADEPSEKIAKMKVKIERLRAENKKLKNLTQVEEPAATIGGPKKPTLRPTAPKIREIAKGPADSPSDAAAAELNKLKKELAEKEAQIKNLNNDLIETQTKLAEMKAQGPSDQGTGNMMELLQDLQSKIRRLKGIIKKKDTQIEQLQG